MKKILFILALFILGINVVWAEEDAYLENLEVRGYELTPAFDKYNNTYSVLINEEDTSLNLDYQLTNSEAEVEIIGNDLITEDEGKVEIKISYGEEAQTYTILVNKDTTEKAALIDDSSLELNITPEYNMKFILAGLIVGWLVIVFIFYKIIFHKRRNKI